MILKGRYCRYICPLMFLLFLGVGLSPYSYTAPRIELGAGIASQHLRDYRGSNSEQFHILPVPVMLYRGDRLKVDRGGARGEIFQTERLALNLSVDAALNGDSDDNLLREDMPELAPAFELGPSLDIKLLGDSFSEGVSLRMPLRGVFIVDDVDVKNIGYQFVPQITYKNIFEKSAWQFKASLAAIWASEKNHDYFYGVASQYATDFRPEYQAKEGYSGLYLKASLKRRKGPYLMGLSARYDKLEGAVFVDSPLVETHSYFITSLFFAYFFYSGDG